MPLPDPFIPDQSVRRNFEALERRFPVQAQDFGHDLGTWFAPPTFGTATNTTATANRLYYSQVIVPAPATLTGILYMTGATANGNVRAALYNASGTRVVDGTTNVAQTGTLAANKVAFDAAYSALPGAYFAALIFSSGTGTFLSAIAFTPAGAATQGGFATPSSITLPTTVQGAQPTMTTY